MIDPVVLACSLAERLPANDLEALTAAATEGRSGLLELRAATPAAVVRAACDDLLTVLPRTTPGLLAGMLAGAAGAVASRRRRQRVQIVWTGPPSGVNTGRLTAAVVTELIDSARREILLVSFATHSEPTINQALERAVARGVEVTLLLERHEDNPHYTGPTHPLPHLPATRLAWPASQRPAGAALHAKVVVIDQQTALIGSANLTSFALEHNVECGVLIHGGPQPGEITNHVRQLVALGHLCAVPVTPMY